VEHRDDGIRIVITGVRQTTGTRLQWWYIRNNTSLEDIARFSTRAIQPIITQGIISRMQRGFGRFITGVQCASKTIVFHR